MGENNYFKESIYLGENNLKVIEHINSMRDVYTFYASEDRTTYSDNIAAYDKFVKKIAYLVSALNASNNAITASIIIDLLIRKGIFSADGVYSKQKHMNQQLMGAFGIDVVAGAGVCRNTASFHSDILRAMNQMSYPFYCYGTNDMSEDGNEHESNHVVNLIEYNNALYGYDAFNSMLFKLVSDREMVQMFSKEPLKLYYKPYIDLMLEGLSLGNINNLMSVFDMVKDNKLITHDEYKDMWKYAKEVISENSYLLGLFQETSKKRIKEITKGLN